MGCALEPVFTAAAVRGGEIKALKTEKLLLQILG